MPRANRYILPGQIYHVTHRCHDRSFLLRFARDRELYRTMMRDRAERFAIVILGYCLTSNHVHMLVKVSAGGPEGLARFMQSLAGDFAQAYNLRKGRTGAFWGDRYHAVMIDGGEYLWRCLRYIDLNMVRAGVVREPVAWAWCGYQEVSGMRKRYRAVALDELAEALAPGQPIEKVVSQYVAYVADGLKAETMGRAPMWTESVAVGSEDFVRKLGKRIDGRIKMTVEAVSENLWTVREERKAYGSFSRPINSSKGSNAGEFSSQLVDSLS